MYHYIIRSLKGIPCIQLHDAGLILQFSGIAQIIASAEPGFQTDKGMGGFRPKAEIGEILTEYGHIRAAVPITDGCLVDDFIFKNIDAFIKEMLIYTAGPVLQLQRMYLDVYKRQPIILQIK